MRSRLVERLLKVSALLGAFMLASVLALKLHLRGEGLWQGLAPASAASAQAQPYDLTQLKVTNEVLRIVRDKYVDPKRVRPREMLLSALNYVQRDVAQIIVLHDEGAPTVKVRVDTQEREFRVDNVQGPWDVASRLHDVFAFVQDNLRGTEVDLREVEYAACNGMLHTLDPHTVLLSPEAYKDMNMSTSGQFGGLGIVISLRDQQLTVINPMPATPAGRAGVRRHDRITKINNESTLNMGLNEAVNHLRGVPGSKVTVWIHRDGSEGWQGSRPFELTRETIHVASVESKLLEGNIGYVRLKAFQANSAGELDTALLELKKGGELKGLVLDLRGNPGGLLDQAVKITDKFVQSGPIVATVGHGEGAEGRDERVAHLEGTEPNYPIVLLVSGTSASASEIVAGAMKNHDRAVIVGETTFGKGSVQLIFTEMPDKAALKLTIAQYLTEPGDISIQGTGVTPDIELDPMTVDLQEMDLNADQGGLVKERDLSRSLSNAHTREGQRPSEVLRYYLGQKERIELLDRGGDPDDAAAPDFPTRFARELAARSPATARPDQVRAAKAFIESTRAAELAKVVADLQKQGIDWSDAPADVTAQQGPVSTLDVKVETDRAGDIVTAGEQIAVKVTVTNKGTLPVHRLFATTKSDNGMFDNKEFAFGKLEPGKSRTVTTPLGWCDFDGRKIGSTVALPKDTPRVCRIPKDALTRADGIKLRFEEARGRIPADAEARVSVRALERPVFSYAYQLVDNRKGNGDGRVQKGEELTMYLVVKNAGKGRSFDAQANLRNLSGDGLLLHEGRFNDVSNMAPGETRKVSFTFDVQPQLEGNEAKVELSIIDQELRESVVEKVRIPIVAPSSSTPLAGPMKAALKGAALQEAADPASRTFGRLAAGVGVTAAGGYGDYVKVSLGAGRFGFVKQSELEVGGAPAPIVAFEDAMTHAPPLLEIAPPALFTRDAKITLRGSASDDARLLDVYVFSGSRKVFYRSNRNGPDPKKMAFEADAPLRAGVNVITVVARENPDTTSRRVFVVRKDGAAGELLQTPRTEDDGGEGAGLADD
jgi:carboxyl-terminal processing protease